MAAQLYNKPEHRHTLVGNWQEEQKLLEDTGVHRYKVGVLQRFDLSRRHHDLLCLHMMFSMHRSLGIKVSRVRRCIQPDRTNQSRYRRSTECLHTLKDR